MARKELYPKDINYQFDFKWVFGKPKGEKRDDKHEGRQEKPVSKPSE